jgi:hypothetical protein
MGQPGSGRVLDRLNSSIRNALPFLAGSLWLACFEPVSRQTKTGWFNVHPSSAWPQFFFKRSIPHDFVKLIPKFQFWVWDESDERCGFCRFYIHGEKSHKPLLTMGKA